MQKIIARVSSRAFVGLPLCENHFSLVRLTVTNSLHPAGRNEEYLSLAVDFAVDFMKTVVVLRLFPTFLKP